MATLVMIPGCPGNADDFSFLQSNKLGHKSVVAEHLDEDSIQGCAQKILAEIDGDLSLIGFSFGGVVALHLAIHRPDRVKKLILLGTSAHREPPELLEMRHAQLDALKNGTPLGDLLTGAYSMFFHNAEQDEQLKARFEQMVQSLPLEPFIAQFKAMVSRLDLREHLKLINCPTLVLCGAQDQVFPPAHSKELADNISGAKIALIEDCGHFLSWQRPDVVAEKVLDFIAY